MDKLDVKDRKIIYYLSKDARMSRTQLAKKLRLSKNTVKYRIERLLKEGIIKNFTTTLELEALGLSTVDMFLRFNEDIYEKKQILDYFNKHEYVDWVCTLSGEWDLFIEIVIKDFSHLIEVVDGITQKFGNILDSYKVLYSLPIRVEHLIKDFYADLKLGDVRVPLEKVERVKIDAVDKKILAILSKDSSLPYLKIAQKLGLKIDKVRYRMKNLIDKGVIMKCFPEIDLQKLGYTEYLYKIEFSNLTKEKYDKIKSRIRNNNNITYAFADVNSFTIIFVCAFKIAEDIDKLSRGLRKEFSDVIDKQDYYIIKEQPRFNLFPRGLLE
ncbi:winged helix-turn-helix transcriptional regulator [Candidatus Woesearchaeota archaeon]|nr:winged helix-turn-helix transcriptional regulator [Candidatus Woesearchaeota archaeon]